VTLTQSIVSIENVVATGDVFQRVDLVEITKKFPGVEYHPETFPGLVFRLKSPKTSTLIFGSGKMVCTGARSEEQAVKAIRAVAENLHAKHVIQPKEPKTEVQNIVASGNLGGKIYLEEAARQLPRSIYEPEQFPGVIHRMVEPKCVFLLFASGKLVCTGAKSSVKVYQAVSAMHNNLEQRNLMMY